MERNAIVKFLKPIPPSELPRESFVQLTPSGKLYNFTKPEGQEPRPVGRPPKQNVQKATAQIENEDISSPKQSANDKRTAGIDTSSGGKKRPLEYSAVTPVLKAVLTSYCHKWLKNGEHGGFRSGQELVDHAKGTLGYCGGDSTILKILTDERKDYMEGGGLRTRPDISEIETVLITAVGSGDKVRFAPNASRRFQVHEFAREPKIDMPSSELGPIFLKAVKERVLPFKGTGGFGVRTVRIHALTIYKELYPDAEVAPWQPSDTWCIWFLHSVLDMNFRRISGKLQKSVQASKSEELFEYLSQQLALDLADGTPPSLLYGSDEFGLYFFPQHEYAWETVGSKRVLVEIYDDKRQYTANIGHTADGRLAPFQIIFGGKSEASLPALERRKQPGAEHFIWGVSENHWSNITEKKKQVLAYVADANGKKDQLVKGNVMSAIAARETPIVLLLDCWPVNLSKEFRDWMAAHHPLVKLRYIPAGMTSTKQINDTYFHSPFKKWMRAFADDWYERKVSALYTQYKNNEITLESMQQRIRKLMEVGTLRDLSVDWNLRALQKLSEADSDGVNLVSKGWHGIFGRIFTVEYQELARKSRDKLKQDEAHALLIASLIADNRDETAPADVQEEDDLEKEGSGRLKQAKKKTAKAKENRKTAVAEEKEKKNAAALRHLQEAADQEKRSLGASQKGRDPKFLVENKAMQQDLAKNNESMAMNQPAEPLIPANMIASNLDASEGAPILPIVSPSDTNVDKTGSGFQVEPCLDESDPSTEVNAISDVTASQILVVDSIHADASSQADILDSGHSTKRRRTAAAPKPTFELNKLSLRRRTVSVTRAWPLSSKK